MYRAKLWQHWSLLISDLLIAKRKLGRSFHPSLLWTWLWAGYSWLVPQVVLCVYPSEGWPTGRIHPVWVTSPWQTTEGTQKRGFDPATFWLWDDTPYFLSISKCAKFDLVLHLRNLWAKTAIKWLPIIDFSSVVPVGWHPYYTDKWSKSQRCVCPIQNHQTHHWENWNGCSMERIEVQKTNVPDFVQIRYEKYISLPFIHVFLGDLRRDSSPNKLRVALRRRPREQWILHLCLKYKYVI